MPSKPITYRPSGVPTKRERRQSYDRQRSNEQAWRAWYKTKRWQRNRAIFLRAHPLCVECEAEGRLAAASVVDHRIPHRGNERMFWEVSNWQALCKWHHDRKTGRGE